ncbi:FtsW/RodA/SpoVE family cell cycle protein [Lactobacillus sp. Sy-1]|uniref:FtsW/RodA/SpoVE family cell cycle protein n=1 Tax=Lactobacillus sp. Sy-1 TaxID=2109645 RepID=UPI001C566ABB|nr:FtsW/RodA/SpoVE family cell cycle protein [Lactobacillus sp. Sy-1]MBW1605443.1 FtsW/RodA/SpoVE family cell cycle protein [Lactobacillus sp. Sy-1]
MKLKRITKDLDYFLLVPYAILCVIGIIMVFSASSNIEMQNGGTAISYLIKQLMYVVVGLLMLAGIFRINQKQLRNAMFISATGVFFIILFVYLMVFGKSINGSAGWLNFGGFGVQPAEFVKLYFILLYARVLSRDEKKMEVFTSWKSFLKAHIKTMITTIIILVLILFLPDLGGTLINFTIVIVMILASGVSYKRSFRILAGSLALAYLLLYLLAFGPLKSLGFLKHSYMFQRVVAFANPFVHANGIGQQLVNSYYAISNGGIFGKGIGNSIQKTGYLPEPNTDFIMAIISEELGLIGVLIIMGLLCFMILRIITIGVRSNDGYSSLICYGTATYLVVQTYFNVGGVTGILPITGVTFPFISYGGSSMITLCLCLGLVLKISYKQKIARREQQAVKGDY